MTVLPILLSLAATAAVQASDVASADVADAAERIIDRRAHMTHEIQRLAGRRMTGPAVTLRLVRDDSASAAEAGAAVIQLLEAAPPGAVMVAVLEGDKGFAVFGEGLAVLARARRLAGVVVDGSVRDIAQLRQMGLPLFGRGTAPGSAAAHYRVAGVNVPVVSGGIHVRPGDHVVGDENGVVVVPRERWGDVLSVAGRIHDEERRLVALIDLHGSYNAALQARSAEQQAVVGAANLALARRLVAALQRGESDSILAEFGAPAAAFAKAQLSRGALGDLTRTAAAEDWVVCELAREDGGRSILVLEFTDGLVAEVSYYVCDASC